MQTNVENKAEFEKISHERYVDISLERVLCYGEIIAWTMLIYVCLHQSVCGLHLWEHDIALLLRELYKLSCQVWDRVVYDRRK